MAAATGGSPQQLGITKDVIATHSRVAAISHTEGEGGAGRRGGGGGDSGDSGGGGDGDGSMSARSTGSNGSVQSMSSIRSTASMSGLTAKERRVRLREATKKAILTDFTSTRVSTSTDARDSHHHHHHHQQHTSTEISRIGPIIPSPIDLHAGTRHHGGNHGGGGRGGAVPYHKGFISAAPPLTASIARVNSRLVPQHSALHSTLAGGGGIGGGGGTGGIGGGGGCGGGRGVRVRPGTSEEDQWIVKSRWKSSTSGAGGEASHAMSSTPRSPDRRLTFDELPQVPGAQRLGIGLGEGGLGGGGGPSLSQSLTGSVTREGIRQGGAAGGSRDVHRAGSSGSGGKPRRATANSVELLR